MKPLLTGATGFTGSHVLALLEQRGIPVRCYVRDARKAEALQRAGVEVSVGDLADVDRLAAACQGCDTLLNVASIGFGHGAGIVRAAENGGIHRAVFVSTTAIFTQLNAPSKVVRTAAEQAIRSSKLAWTILRPTMIYGTSRDRNICRLIRYVRRYPVLPVFGSGEYLMQPVHVDDLAAAIVAAGSTAAAERKEYNISGREPLSYNQLVGTVAQLAKRRTWMLHLPHRPVIKLLQAFEQARLRLPIKAEQIQRLNEHKAFPWDAAGRDLEYSPRGFAEGVATEIAEMSSAP